MAKCSGIKYVDDTRALVGYGDTKDFALNELLNKLERCQMYRIMFDGDEVCRPF